MAETRYRQITEKELPQKEFSYPGNRRQIGRPQDTKTELFIEDYALSFAKEGDVIILAGKGQETYQIIGKEKFDFDERVVVFECLNKK